MIFSIWITGTPIMLARRDSRNARRLPLVLVVVSLFSTEAEIELKAGLILQPWTTTETGVISPVSGMCSWSANTLTLTYGGYAGANAIAGDYISLPSNAIGIAFGASGTLKNSRASVTVDAWDSQDSFTRQLILTNEITVESDGTVSHRWGDLTDWSFGSVGNGSAEFLPSPETTNGEITSLSFLFTAEILNGEHHRVYFNADGRQSDGTTLAGTTTYSDVSWILSDSSTAVPEPSSFILSLGLGSMAVMVANRRRKRIGTIPSPG